MNDKLTTCLLCGSELSSLFDQITFRNMPVTNRLCNHCGLVFQAPRISAQEAEEFHKSRYRELHQAGKLSIDNREINFQQIRAQSMIHLFSQYVQAVNKYLDIGCSSGMLMKEFSDQFHCDAYGVEIDDLYRPYALEHGWIVFPSLEDIPSDTSFDVVSLIHVLEHLPDPVQYLKVIREKYLDTNGWLYLEVPNLYSHDCFELAHLSSFSVHTIEQVLDQAGFHIERIVKHGLPRSKVLPLYINIIARPYPPGYQPSPVIPEKMVRIKRRAGRFVYGIVTLPVKMGKQIRRFTARIRI